jgi:polyhydroxyalkanoate synthesis regulator phasin
MDGLGDIAKSLHDKVDDLAEEHGDQIDKAIDKLGDVAERKVGAEHAGKVAKAEAKAHDVVDDMRKPD